MRLLRIALIVIVLCLLLAQAAVPMVAQGPVDDCNPPSGPAPAPMGASKGGTYVTDTDNENNARTGSADGDMGGASPPCIWDSDANHPIEFNIAVTGPLPSSSAALAIAAYDVDEGRGREVDEVYFNGHLLGTLTGQNNQWSTTLFAVNPDWVVSGDNLVEILVDVASPGDYCAVIAWGQLLIDGGQGASASINRMSVDDCFEVGPEVTIDVDMVIGVNNAGDYTLEVNLVNPNSINVGARVMTFTTSLPGTVNQEVSFALGAASTIGTYTVAAILFDDANVIQEIEQKTFEYSVDCSPPPVPDVPEASTLGLLIPGAMGLAGYVGLQLRARRRRS